MIYLSKVTVAQAEEMLQAMHVEQLANFQFFEKKVGVTRQRAYLRRIERDGAILYGIRLRKGNQLIGTIGLHDVDAHLKTARLGVMIFSENYRGGGRGRRAIQLLLNRAFKDTRLKLNKVYLNVFASNFKGQHLYESMGFDFEGRLKEEYLLRGEYHDLIRLAMLRRTWEQVRRDWVLAKAKTKRGTKKK